MYPSLEYFIKDLEQAGELIRIKTPANPVLEIAEITDRIAKEPGGGKALLFENTGTAFPVLTNAMGSAKRINMALNIKDMEGVSRDMEHLFSNLMTHRDTLAQKIRALPLLGKMARWLPASSTHKGKCQEVIQSEPDLSLLPVLQCWPGDGGRFITLPMVHTKDPDTGQRNCGMYRMQIMGKALTGMHWHRHKTGAQHFEAWKSTGKHMPVAVTLGGDPVYTYCATAPLPGNVDEYLLAGYLRKKKVEMVRCLTQDIEVPSDADFVIEGYVDTHEGPVWEGPFGDHTGFYSLPDWYPSFHVTCITHRKNAVYPATIVGIPPQEDAYFAAATERIFLAPIKLTMLPEINDLHMPPAGTAHNLALASISKSYPGQGLKAIYSLWGGGQMMLNKGLIITDFPIRDYKEAVRLILQRADFHTDLIMSKGPLDVLDHSSPQYSYGSKWALDCTTRFPEEKNEALPRNVIPDARTLSEKTHQAHQLEHALRSHELVEHLNLSLIEEDIPVIACSLNKPSEAHIKDFAREIFQNPLFGFIRLIVVLDSDTDLSDWMVVTWLACSNTDPERDFLIHPNQSQILINATTKSTGEDAPRRLWPNKVLSNPDTIRNVDEKWADYQLGPFISSPSLRYGNPFEQKGVYFFNRFT